MKTHRVYGIFLRIIHGRMHLDNFLSQFAHVLVFETRHSQFSNNCLNLNLCLEKLR